MFTRTVALPIVKTLRAQCFVLADKLKGRPSLALVDRPRGNHPRSRARVYQKLLRFVKCRLW